MSNIFNPQHKILCHLNKVEQYFDKKNPSPITIEIDPSNTCNHSCPFCISGHLHLKKYKGTEYFNRTILKKNTFHDLIKDLVKLNIEAINWTGGGEPTQNPYLGEAIKFIKKNSSIEMGMFSNGTLLEKMNLMDIVVDCLKWIRISIDAGTALSYDKLRVTNKSNNFDTVIKNIKKIVDLKNKKKSNITIGVGFVVTEDNYNEILDFANIFKEIGVDYCQYKPEIIQIERQEKNSDLGRVQISSDFWIKKVINLLDQAKQTLGKKFECNDYKIDDLIIDVKKYGRNYKECIGSQFQPCVGADGNVYVCTNHRGHKKYSYGNVNEKKFSDIWNDLKKRQSVMELINKKEKFSNCTHLCKPHESNKILWKIKENQKNEKYFEDLKSVAKNITKSTKHKNFI